MKANIYYSSNGDFIGTAGVDPQRYAENCSNDEGHVAAGDILDDEDLERLGLSADSTIYGLTI